MERRFNVVFEPEFMNYLVQAQKEANRTKIPVISEFLLFKVLVNNTDTFISECFHYAGVNWKKVETTLDTQWKICQKEFAPERVCSFNYQNADGEIIEVHCEKHLFDLMISSTAYAEDTETITEVTFMMALFILNEVSKYIVNFLRQIHVDDILVRRYYEGICTEIATDVYLENKMQENVDNQEENDIFFKPDMSLNQEENEFTDESDTDSNSSVLIPAELAGCLSVITADPDNPSPILGREKETEAVMKVLLKNKKRNSVLVGKPGVGKTAIMEHLAWKIAKGECADELKDKKILMLDVNGIVAGTMYRGMAEERFQILSDYLDHMPNIILYIDEIHNVLGAGSSSNSSLDLANSLKPILARENVAVIGATTTEEYYMYFERDKAFKRRFEIIMVEEPKYSEVYPMLKLQIGNLIKIHKVSITQPVINFIIKIASCFNSETYNPDVSLDLIDKSLASAKAKKEKVVTKAIVLSNFADEYERFSKMSDNTKMSVAYHEAGHYLVRRYVESNQSKLNLLAISIIPTNSHLGVTVFDTSNYNDILWGYKEIVNEIAVDLGGRVAEKMYTGEYSAGASSDLNVATSHARAMLLTEGLVPEFSSRNFEMDLDDDARKKLNAQIDSIIDEGYKLAETILSNHEDVLKNLSSSLVENGILVDKEVEKICKEVENNNKKKDPKVEIE